MKSKIVVVIPAFNEEQSIHKVVTEIPMELVDEVVVVDNNSKDNTVEVAERAGATVLNESRQGYGSACLKGIQYAKEMDEKPDIILFMDGDYSDFPIQSYDVVKPIIEEGFDMVIGSRSIGDRQKGSMTPQQIIGNQIAATLLRMIYGIKTTDLGPFRAIRFDKLLQIGMIDKDYGWTVEMQVKAAKHKLKTCEVPVDYRVRIGESKVSGTVKGTILAGYKIITTIFKYAF